MFYFIAVSKILKYIYKGIYICVTNRNVKTFINNIFFFMDSKEQLYNSLMMRPFLMTCISSIAVVVDMTRHHVCILNSAD